MCKSMGFIVTATILGPVVILFMALAFSTNYWLIYDVDRSSLEQKHNEVSWLKDKAKWYFHSRSRGIFRVCFPENRTLFLINNPDKIGDSCLGVSYEPPINRDSGYSTEYWQRLHLMRCHMAFMIGGLVIFTIAYMLGVVLCCQRQSSWAKAAGIFAFFAAFSTAMSIAFFHGAEYIERTTITQKDDGEEFYKMWPVSLQEATTRSYAWSYIMAWIGTILAAICAALYVIAGWMLSNEINDDSRDILAKRHYAEMNGPPMFFPDNAAIAYDDPYYSTKQVPRGYYGPYVYEMQDRAGYPASGYGDQAVWQWQ